MAIIPATDQGEEETRLGGKEIPQFFVDTHVISYLLAATDISRMLSRCGALCKQAG